MSTNLVKTIFVLLMALVLTHATTPIALADEGGGKVKAGVEVTYEYDADESKFTVCIKAGVELGPYGAGVKVCQSGDQDDGPSESPDLDLPWVDDWTVWLCIWMCADINIGIVQVNSCTDEACTSIG